LNYEQIIINICPPLVNAVAVLLRVVFYTSGVTHFWESCMEKNKCPKLRVFSFDEMRYFPFRDI